MKIQNIPSHILLFILFVFLVIIYVFAGHDPTIKDMMLGTFAAALAVLRNVPADNTITTTTQVKADVATPVKPLPV